MLALSGVAIVASDFAANTLLRGFLIKQVDSQLENVTGTSLMRLDRAGIATSTIIVLAVLALVLVYFIASYNRLIRLNVNVDEAFSQIEVQLKRRSDLIPNLVETVKGYAAHEKSALESVVNARAKATSATTVADVAAADGQLTQALRGLLAVSEAYPDLKASSNFLSLQEELSTTENKVSFSRQFYNDNVRSLNQSVKTFPGNLFAGVAKITSREFYEVEDPQDRKAPNVKF